MSLLTGSRHPGDEDLIRYMDHQLDREAHRLMGAHLRTCAECTGRLDGFQQKSALVSDWLKLLPEAMPDDGKRAVALAAVDRARFRRRAVPFSSGAMRAAAAVVLMLGVGLGTAPGRAFVAGGVVKLAGRDPGPLARRMVEWLGEERALPHQAPTLQSEPVPAAPAVGAPRVDAPAPRAARAEPERPRIKPGMSAPVTFTPRGPDVTLVFSSVQAVGAATVWIKDVPRANGQVVTHFHGEELAPNGDGLEVRNRRESTSDYIITVPSRYRFIRVRVADSPEMQIRISKSKQEWIWTINLQTSALQ
jgi:hypothetical protein